MGAWSRHGAATEWLSHREACVHLEQGQFVIVWEYSEPVLPRSQKKVTFLVGGKRQHYSQTKQTTLVLLGRILRADFGVGVANE